MRAVFAGHLASEGDHDQQDQQAADAGDPAVLHGEVLAAGRVGGENRPSERHRRGAHHRQQAGDDGDHVSGGAVAERAEHYQQRDHRQRSDDGERHHGGIGGIAVCDAGNERERHQYHVRDDLDRQYFAESDLRRVLLGNGLRSGHLGPPFHIVVIPYAI